MNSDNILTFDFGTLEEHISQLLPEFIENFIKSLGIYKRRYFNDDLEFYAIRIPNSRDNFLTAIKIHDSCSDFSVKEVDERYQQDIARLYRSTLMTRSESTFAINLKYGHYAIDYFQAFLDIGNTELAYSFIRKYKIATALRVQANEKKIVLDINIQTIYKFAKKNCQYKNIYSHNPQSIKNYCDGDFECYLINEHTLNIVCYTSSVVYSFVFDQYGNYKVYAQRTHYGRKCELLQNFDYQDCDVHFELTLMKHMYEDEFIIFEHADTDALLAYDFIIVDLLTITNFIVKAELIS